MAAWEFENLSGFFDKHAGISAKKYAKMKSEASFSKKEALAIREDSTEGQRKINEVAGKPEFFVPLSVYEKGLPGKNLIRANTLDHLVCFAKVVGNSFVVYQVENENEFNQKMDAKHLIGAIPLSAIIKIEVVDLRSTRVMRRAGAKIANRMVYRAVNAVSLTHLDIVANKANASRLIIYYVDEAGVIVPASFVFPSNSKFGTAAIQSLKSLRNGLSTMSKLEPILWSIVDMDSGTTESVEDLTENGEDDLELLEFEDVSMFVGDVSKLIGYLNLLSGDDSAVMTAKLSAEMISSVIQKDKLPLVMSSDENE